MIRELIEEIEIEKLAAEALEGATIDPGWLEGQHGVARAMRAPGSVGVKKLLADPKLIGMRERNALGHSLIGGGLGLAGGAGIGAIIGAMKGHAAEGAAIGAMVGGMGGSAIGQGHGINEADQEFLAEKGIKSNWMGLQNRFTPEAAAQYLPEKYDSKGQKKTSSNEIEDLAAAVLYEAELEKMAEAYLDEMALELANEWLEKNAGLLNKALARLGSSRAAMSEAAGAVGREGATAAKTPMPFPGTFKSTLKGAKRRAARRRGAQQQRSESATRAVLGKRVLSPAG